MCRSDHKQTQKLPKPLHVQNQALRLPRNDPNTTKIILCKTETRVLNYYNSKFINNTLFRDQVRNKLRSSNLQISDRDLRHFKEICLPVLNTIVLRANQTSFINKESQRAVMVVRSKLRKKLLKSRSVSDKKAYNKQKNKWISLLRKTEKA